MEGKIKARIISMEEGLREMEGVRLIRIKSKEVSAGKKWNEPVKKNQNRSKEQNESKDQNKNKEQNKNKSQNEKEDGYGQR